MRILLTLLLSLAISCLTAQSAPEFYKAAQYAYQTHDYENSIAAVDKAIELDGEVAAYYILKAYAHRKLKQHADGVGILSEAIQRFPEEPLLYVVRGNMLISLFEFEEAVVDHTLAYDLAEAQGKIELMHDAILNRGVAKSQIRDYQGAYEDLQEARAHEPDNIVMLNALGTVADHIGRGEETLTIYEQIIALDSTFLPAYLNTGYKYQLDGRYQQSLAYFDKVIDLAPDEALGYSNRALSHLRLGNTDQALLDINVSLRLFPENAYAHKVKALILIELGEPDKACERLQEARVLGYEAMYGDEVEQLLQTHCRD